MRININKIEILTKLLKDETDVDMRHLMEQLIKHWKADAAIKDGEEALLLLERVNP